MSLLLSDEAIEQVVNSMPELMAVFDDSVLLWIINLTRAVVKAQAKFMLEQLEKEGRIRHQPNYVMQEATKGSYWSTEWEHNRDDCWLCAALREVEGK